MRVWEHQDHEGRTCAIEVPSLTGRRRVTRLASRVPGVTLIRSPKALSWVREESFCEFDLDGERYSIEEPYGDNSRYWIGRAQFGWHPSFCRIVAAFRESGLWFGRARLGVIALQALAILFTTSACVPSWDTI